MKSFALKAFLDIPQARAGARSGELIRPQNNLFHSFHFAFNPILGRPALPRDRSS
jgi:hypothetical protein